MYVVTIDQRDSRTSADRVPELLAALDTLPCTAPFERTAGDEVQGLIDDVVVVRQVLLTALRDGHWHCGVGAGPVDAGSWESGTRAGRGLAYLAAREAVDAAKDLPGSVAIRVPAGGETVPVRSTRTGAGTDAVAGASSVDDSATAWAADCEAIWTLVAGLVLDRTDAQWRAVDAVDASETQAAAAKKLGITPTSVAGALRLSGIREERAAYGTLDRLLAGAHDAAVSDDSSANRLSSASATTSDSERDA